MAVMGTIYAVGAEASESSLANKLSSATWPDGRPVFTLPMVLGLLIAAIAGFWAAQYHPEGLQNQLALPVFKDTLINLGFLFVPFAILVIVGAANAVNLTDGLDGLAIMPAVLLTCCSDRAPWGCREDSVSDAPPGPIKV